MLILTRRIGETLMVGDNVTITVLSVKGNQVRVGVKAPAEVAVHREEIYNRIHEEGSGKKSSANNLLNTAQEQEVIHPTSDDSISSDNDNSDTTDETQS